MKTHFTFLLFIFSIFISNLTAQDVVWEEQFDGGFNGWSEDTISTSSDSLSWKWTETGSVGPVMLNPIPAPNCMSPTALNGAAYVNFEYWMFGATLDNVSFEPPYGELVSHLISPSIDLSDVSTPLSLRFFQLAKLLIPASDFEAMTMVSFSSDGGQTWSKMMDLNPDLPVREISNESRTIRIPANIGLQGQSDVHIRFTFSGSFYYYMIDDIQLIERNGLDIKIVENSFTIPPNYSTPKEQTEPFPLVASITNIGGEIATNVTLNAQVRNVRTGEILFEKAKTFDFLEPDSIVTDIFLGNYRPLREGLYEVTYTLDSDSQDINLGDNSAVFNFEVNVVLFRKEDGTMLGGFRSKSNNSWSVANVFYIPENNFNAAYMNFGVTNADKIIGQFMTMKLLKSRGDENRDGIFSPEEYDLVTFNGYTFDGTENNQIILISADLDGNPIQLEKGYYYLVVMEYTDLIDQNVAFLGTNAHNYKALENYTAGQDNPRYGSLVDFGNTGNFAPFENNKDNFVPTIRVGGTFVDIVCNTHELSPGNKTGIFPNPATDFLNLDMDFSEMCGLVEITISDASGKVFLKNNYQNIQKDRVEFDLGDYPIGAYFLSLKTSIGERTLPFFIQH